MGEKPGLWAYDDDELQRELARRKEVRDAELVEIKLPRSEWSVIANMLTSSRLVHDGFAGLFDLIRRAGDGRDE